MLGADALAFGCEDDFSTLEKIYRETKDVSFEKELMALIDKEKNLSYPKAKEMLVAAKLGEKAAEIIAQIANVTLVGDMTTPLESLLSKYLPMLAAPQGV